MIKSRNGFMLVEVIIASTVIVTTMIVLYSSFHSLFSKYESRTSYHDIDALYASKEMVDYFFSHNFKFNEFINNEFHEKESIYIIKDGNCNNELTDIATFCDTLNSLYHLNTMIFTSYDKENLENLKKGLKKEGTNEVIVEKIKNQTMKEYIDYVIEYYNIKDSNITEQKNEYDYVLMTERIDEENSYYASLPIR